ncbi:alanine dehydrogenase [Actinomadura atramentaria]|uniref:alanine dehydrogenase n=1 Tax=Actinomadura atramentaria TaxID=1990 RepID=UPI0003817ADB|nr:alanine dehydrogenase [Actinomadura atramentaria]
MRIGVPREIKDNEYRVAITPAGVHELTRHGHEVFVERGAGTGSAVPDAEFADAGAKIVDGPDAAWGEAELVLKVKEPVPAEYHRMGRGQTLFTYLHLAASRDCADALLAAGVTAVGYETVQLPNGSLPLLAPMSEVAGRLAAQVGAYNLMKFNGGRGVLPGGVPGVAPARVTVIGGGVAGLNAARIAAGMGADVTVMDVDVDRLRAIDAAHGGRIRTLVSTAYSVRQQAVEADLVVGAVLIPGARAPKLVSGELVAHMKEGSVLVDIAIDQGGCFEDSRPTTHADPTYRVHGSLFYCVANMPGSVPNTSTYALTNVTLPYALKIAALGWREAMRADPALALGLNTHAGRVVNGPVAEAHGLERTPLEVVLAS